MVMRCLSFAPSRIRRLVMGAKLLLSVFLGRGRPRVCWWWSGSPWSCRNKETSSIGLGGFSSVATAILSRVCLLSKCDIAPSIHRYSYASMAPRYFDEDPNTAGPTSLSRYCYVGWLAEHPTPTHQPSDGTIPHQQTLPVQAIQRS